MPGFGDLTDKELAEVHALAASSAAAQGLPAKVADPAILRQVAGLVRPELAAPDERDTRRVEGVAAGSRGADDCVVEHGGDDCGLAA